MRWLREHTEEVGDNPGYRYLPDSKTSRHRGVRMSLSVPLLLSAIPCIAKIGLFCDRAERERLRRCISVTAAFPVTSDSFFR